MTRFSKARTAWLGLSPRPRLRGRPRGSDALHQCLNSQLFHLCSLRLGPFSQSRRSPSDCNLLLSVLHHPHIHFAPLLAGVIDRDARDDKGREQEQCDGVVGPTFHKGGAVLIHARRRPAFRYGTMRTDVELVVLSAADLGVESESSLADVYNPVRLDAREHFLQLRTIRIWRSNVL